MRDKKLDWDDSYDYSPNELANLAQTNPEKYRRVVESNLEDITVEEWEERNMNYNKTTTNIEVKVKIDI